MRAREKESKREREKEMEKKEEGEEGKERYKRVALGEATGWSSKDVRKLVDDVVEGGRGQLGILSPKLHFLETGCHD